ncbi:hypothetical protein [Streptomyces sp. NPDC018947]|uniref:hypothetical protein n=1 Tax=Streptomyces sp. NPDC018947 TaxID=3365054 RepID=UPI0037ACB348
MAEVRRHGAVLRAWFRETLPAAGNARRLGVLTLIQSLGLGVFLTSSAVFFTRTLGIPAQRMGLALSVAGLCGLVCTVPIGRLADRLGAGRVLTVNFLLAAADFTAYCLVDGFAAILAVACAIAVLETSADQARPKTCPPAHPGTDHHHRLRRTLLSGGTDRLCTPSHWGSSSSRNGTGPSMSRPRRNSPKPSRAMGGAGSPCRRCRSASRTPSGLMLTIC